MDAEELTDGDYRLRRSESLVDRSRTLLDSAISRLAKYERLPHSMSSPDKPPRRRPRVGLWRILAKAVACRMHLQATRRHADDDVAKQAGPIPLLTAEQRNTGGSGGMIKKKKKKEEVRRRSSWLPDPHRRWPVQGF